MAKKQNTIEERGIDRNERRYSLEELSQRWSRPIASIEESVRLCEFRRLICTHYEQRGGGPHINHFFLDETLWPFGDCDHKYGLGDHFVIESAYLVDKKSLAGGFYKNKSSQITIPEAEVLRFESIHNLIPEQPEAPPAAKAWNWIKSPELRIAVEAYYHLYEKDGILPNRGHIEQIKQWLKDQHPQLTPYQLKRLSIVVNSRKETGALRISQK